MRVNSYNSNSFKGVAPVYVKDVAATLSNRTLYTEQNLNLNVSNALSGISDVKINNFSSLFLSKRKKLNDFFEVSALNSVPKSISTFFAFNSFLGANNNSVFWSFDEDVAADTTGAALTLNVGNITPVNKNFFEIVFLNDLFCRVSHSDKGVTRHLTLDYSANLSFAIDFGFGFAGIDDPQTFVYFYDQRSDLLVLYKKVLDLPYYVTYHLSTNRLALIQPALGPGFPFPVEAIMKLRPHSAPVESYSLQEFASHYDKTTNNNSLNTTNSRSLTGVENNFILSTPHNTIDINAVANVQVLTLKNELTPQSGNASLDYHIKSTDFTYRDYQKLFTGTGQLLGDDNISVGFNAFTSSVTLKADTISYFHIPNNIFPFVKQNVNDSQLIEAGAIASDHPVKADKIFKKQADNTAYTYFGNSTEENSGEFLCSWLSGSSDINTRPVWVDRYYNPRRVTFFAALTADNKIAIDYTSTATTIFAQASTSALVFDKPSDLYFEPGVYYAYHHIGRNDIQTYLKTLSGQVAQAIFVNYFVNNTESIQEISDVSEFSFDGQQYSKSISLDRLTNKNSFTILFDLEVGNWSVDFANQIVGNFTNAGLGLFNQNYITPFLYFYNYDTLYIHNTDGVVVETVKFKAEIKSIWRKENLKDYFVLLKTGELQQLTTSNVLVKSATLPCSAVIVPSTFYNASSGAVLINTLTGASIYLYSFDNNTFQSTAAVTRSNNIALSTAQSICINDTQVYAISASNTHLSNGKLYYISEPYQVRCWSLSANTDTPFFSASTPVRDFNIDRDDNFWVLLDQKMVKYTSDRQYILSAAVYDTDYKNTAINFTHELLTQGWQYAAVITQTNILTAGQQGIRCLKYNDVGTIVGRFTNQDITLPQPEANVTNDDYSRRVVISTYPNHSLNLKAVVNNAFGSVQTEYNLYSALSAIDTGYHNICIRFDTIQGEMGLFVDGIKQSSVTFNPGDYVFSKSFSAPLTIGAAAFFNNTTLPGYLKNTSGYVTNSKIKNWKIYNIALYDTDIRLIANRNNIRDITLNLPAGQRHLIDEIERYFLLDATISKSSSFVLSLKNTGILNVDLQTLLEKRIRIRLAPILPFNAEMLSITWTN